MSGGELIVFPVSFELWSVRNQTCCHWPTPEPFSTHLGIQAWNLLFSGALFFSWFVDKLPTSIKYTRICLQNSVFLRKQAMTAGSAIMGPMGSWPAPRTVAGMGSREECVLVYLDLKR